MDKQKKNNASCQKELENLEKKQEKAEEKLEEKKEELNSCLTEAQKWENKANEYYDQLIRLKADFENYRKRIEKEKPDLIQWGKSELLLNIMPLYDILLSAHEHIKNVDSEKCSKNQIEELIKGLDMIFKEFSKFFENQGIREIDILNKPYDPMNCEIISIVDGDEKNDGLVVEVLQKGYVFGSKLLRPAKVKIAKRKAENKVEEENQEKK